MKILTKKRRRKTEEEKKEKLINMSKMKKLMKSRAKGDFEYNRNDDEYSDNTHEYEDSDEEEEKEDRTREKGEIDEMSKMKKLMKTRERADFEYNRNEDEY